ncbi:hypothetical protein [Draconibacterium sediminis]|uniref:Lipoprotein n=1 Tax=Draconibacterium sediminis TaxID=1544798 RepID=A0A0D8J4G3_9BACT|nr:hypothetical protein [Draconibacterium sediminis]KJF41840.1 hypothetical protein LH29_23160 [Draconibacterium sediminis]
MERIQQYFRWVKHALLVVIALFSLASCSVKEPLFKTIGAEYQRPLNKTKTTPNFEHHCHTSPDDYRISSNFQNSDHKLFGTAVERAELLLPSTATAEYSFPQPEIVAENTRLYILYKRLKFDMV